MITNKPIGTFLRTSRGFDIVEFKDANGEPCSVQQSSAATVEGDDTNGQGFLWIGINDAKPQILKTKAETMGLPLPPGEVSGWMPYPVPDDVLMTTRMHLNEHQVRALVARLNRWLDSGSLKIKGEREARP
jgi:hypothetical protein